MKTKCVKVRKDKANLKDRKKIRKSEIGKDNVAIHEVLLKRRKKERKKRERDVG